ncbi:MAG: dephospho-CoA kinase [Lactobacillus sp.]|jgi:dephospho-CoA kinase|nr:dephospho-CoA kinase [Lactobacillus sp.]
MTFCLGLTGGIATGKSMAAAFFASQGAKIIDADQIAHELEEPDQKGWQTIKTAFGSDFFMSNGRLNRKKLGRLVFANPVQLEKLNLLLQPLIRAEIVKQIQQSQGLCVLDAPLLFEQGYQHLCARILLIAAAPEIQLQRLQARDQLDRRAAEARIASQLPLTEKSRLADDIINNNGSRQAFEQALTLYWQILIKEVGTL